jgi:glycosyltransferase involved in cell wall biosynthesis
MSVKVAWLPAHPADGSESMLRYWRALQRWTDATRDGVSLVEALGPAPERARRADWLRRTWAKRVAYPARVRALGAGGVEVYHLLDHGFAHVLRELPREAKIVATVHDLAPLDADEGLTAGQVRRFAGAMAELIRAEKLVVPSRYTAERVRERLGVPPERVVVLPMGVDLEVFSPRTPACTEPYILSVGSCAPRKNLGVLTEVMRRVAAATGGLTLVRVGEALPEALREELKRVPGGRLVELGRVDEATLAGYYSGAVALVQPSKLEGFGLPVLEAMACGCPVVSSRATSLPEAGGEAALYFDADDAAAAAGEIVALARDPALRRAVGERGLAHARTFHWSAHVAGLTALYRGIAGT